jgi:threonine aldolase
LIDEARVWRRRHGGTQPQLFGFVAGALPGLDGLAGRMPEFLAHARALATELRDVPGLALVPDPPQTPLFHLLLQGDRESLEGRALELARERGVWLFGPLRPTEVDDVSRIEINVGEPALDISPAAAGEMFGLVLGG